MEPLRLRLALALDAQTLLADAFQLLHRLLPGSLVLLNQVTVAFGSLLFHLLAPRLGFLLELLAAAGKLLLHLGHAALVLLLGLGHLLAGLQQHLLALLAGLLPQLPYLPFRLLADGGGADQLFTLPARLGHDLLGLLARLLDEAFPLTDQLIGLGDLGR